ncbi:MAG: F0F1 ATP synthase subunit A [Anaerolineae bacterium]
MEEVMTNVVASPLGIPIRDTVVSTWITMAIIIAVVWILRKTMPTALEMLIEFVRDQAADIIGGTNVDTYVPFLGTLVIFLIFANNIGILPLVGTPTRDLNVPLALAIVVFFAVHVFGFQRKGLGYLKEQATPLVILDIVGQLSRTLSLSLRLFGNIIAGEIIVAVIYRLVQPIAPLPLVVLSLITGVLQGYIFMFLAASAIGQAVQLDN